ncbi:MAG: metallophosphoesterase, partial [Pseudomonadota bacterium]
AGVIGMPPNDGGRTTRFAILDHGRVQFGTLTYDAATAAHAMTEAGLTQGYDRALVTGYWPSEDVLPKDLKRVSA